MRGSVVWRIMRCDDGKFIYSCQLRPEADRVFALLRSLFPDTDFSILMEVVSK